MARKQMYVVKVVFTPKCPNCAIGIKQSGYLKGGNNMDTFEFKKNGFTIKAERSATYADGKILSSDRNGLYGQIMKGLLVYYALSSNFPKIKKISIVRKRKRFSDIAYSETTDFKQPLNPRKNRTLTFSSQNIDEILNETPKGYAIRTAMTYWLKALNSSDVYF